MLQSRSTQENAAGSGRRLRHRSTGADVAAATLIIGKLLRAKVVFIETGGTIEPSLTGRLVYPFCYLFIVQWPEKRARFPKAVLAGGLLL